MIWNFDMDAAPRGKMETRTHTKKVKGKDVTYTKDYFIGHKLLTAPKNPDAQPIISCFIPDENRWDMYIEKSPPVAWMEVPEHPLKGKNT